MGRSGFVGQKYGYSNNARGDIGAGNDDGDGDGWCGLQKSFGGLNNKHDKQAA